MPPAAVTSLPTVATVSWDDCRLLVASVTDYAIFLLDPSGNVASWNPGAERIKGYKAEEIVGQHFSKFYTQDDIASGKPQRELVQANDEGRVEDEGWRVRKDGGLFWANVVITALRDSNGVLRGFGKVTRDLTERRAAAEALRLSEERFHGLVDAITDYSILLLDADGAVSTWNPGAQRMKGYQGDEVLGKYFAIFYPDEDRVAGKPERVLETVRQHGRFEEEGWRLRKGGVPFWAHVVITGLRNEAEETVAFAKITRDLTEQKATAERLRQSEERFRVLVDGVADYAIYMLSPEGEIKTWNKGAERVKGCTAGEVLGQHFSIFFLPEDVQEGKPAAELATALARGRFQEEGWRLRKDGTRFWASVSLTPLRGQEGELLGFAKVTRDLTAQREAEELARTLFREQAARVAAQQVAARAEEANRIKDEFLATVSHELRTPLNAIVGWSKILSDRKLEPSTAKGVEVIERNARAQVRIVEDILDVSRIITGKLRLDPRPIDFVEVVCQAIEVVRPALRAKRIELHFTPQADVCPLIADAERLQQVVWNLLANAAKFTPAQGTIVVTLDSREQNMVLRVSDNGAGIEPALLPLVFERFRQGDASTTRRVGGLGLGLALVRHIVEMHGGSAAAESAGPGRGATFTITLPIRMEMAASTGEAAEPQQRSSSMPDTKALEGLRVLTVDDDADANELLTTVLAQAGAEVQAAQSAHAAFEALKSFKPHLLVSDIGMPGEDGYSLIRRVRALGAERGGNIPAVALTAYTRSEDRTKALAAGFTSHIGKPVNPRDLVSALSNLSAFVAR